MGAQTDAIKLAVADIQDWWRRFFHCWVADSVWLEHAESLITE